MMHSSYEANDDGFRKLADALLDDQAGHYTLAISDSTTAFHFGVWTATHKATVAAPKDLAKRRGGVPYVELLARRSGGFFFAYGESVRPKTIAPLLTFRDPFSGGPK